MIAHRRRTPDELVDAMNAAIQFPGLTNAWTMPIKTRIDMLSTGIKTPVGIKVLGPDLQTLLADLGQQIEAVDAPGAGHAQRLCRAGHGRQLHRLRHPPRRRSPATA